MDTDQTFNLEFLGIGIMLFTVVVIPFYFIAKHQSYKAVKIASLIAFIIFAILTVGIFIAGIILSSLIVILSAPTLILFVYYLVLFFIAKYQYTRELKSPLLLYLILSLFFAPFVCSIIDLEGFSEFLIDLLVAPINMR